MVGVSAGPDSVFSSTTTPNRALMGSNMQRQAVPLLVPEPPLVSTGPGEGKSPSTPACSFAPREDGLVGLRRFRNASSLEGEGTRSSASTCCGSTTGSTSGPASTRKPIIGNGRPGEEGADHRRRRRDPATAKLALGPQTCSSRSCPGEGYNLRRRHHHQRTAGEERHVHLDSHRGVRHRDPRGRSSARKSFTRDNPERLAQGACRTSTSTASCRSAPSCIPGDILVGKVSPKSRSELTPERETASRDLSAGPAKT